MHTCDPSSEGREGCYELEANSGYGARLYLKKPQTNKHKQTKTHTHIPGIQIKYGPCFVSCFC